ncbi:MAG: hypothetical protein AMS27_12765 [Bacteroides sp. SM23_62_1]|nr:MAG: hypothetical protein AMS27_12765 [Bacteroides sp. SM23_62_1]
MAQNETQSKKYNDLCDTCNHLATCVYIKKGKRPVLYCEEFEILESTPPPEVLKLPEPKVEEEYPVFSGLCKDCGNRKTCMNAKPDVVIWHCEEYV